MGTRSPAARGFLWLLIFVVLGVIFPAGIVGAEGTDGELGSQIIAWSLVLLAAATIASIATISRPRIFAFFLATFTYMWFGLAPLALLRTEGFYWPGIYSSELQFRGMVLALIGVISYALGYSVNLRAFRMDPSSLGFRGLRLRKARPKPAVVLFASLVLTGLLVWSLGGVETFFASRLAFSRALEGVGSSALGNSARWLVAAPVTVCGLWVMETWKVRSAVERVLGVVSIGVMLVVSSPLATTRAWSGAVIFTLVLIVLRRLGVRDALRITLAGFFAGLVVLFPLANAIRSTGDFGSNASPVLGVERFETGDYDAYQQTMNGIRFVEFSGHTLGRQLAGPITFWVPRGLWDRKPEPTGQIIARSAGYTYTNLSSPIWTEAYVDFGLLGVAFVLAAYGALSRQMDEKVLRATSSIVWVIGPLVAAYQLVLVRGPALSAAPAVLVVAAFGWLLREERTSGSTQSPREVPRADPRRLAVG